MGTCAPQPLLGTTTNWAREPHVGNKANLQLIVYYLLLQMKV